MFPPNAFTEGDFSAVYRDAGKPVVLFATSTCPYCSQTRELLARAHVDFKEWTTDKSEQAREKFAALGGDAVPLLFVGHRRIVGYDEGAIRQSLLLAAPDAR
jgi:glutaredoxin